MEKGSGLARPFLPGGGRRDLLRGGPSVEGMAVLPAVSLPWLGDIRTHALMVGLAVVVAVWLAIRSAVRTEGLPLGAVLITVALIAVGVFLGGRLHFALPRLELFAAEPLRLLRISSGGLHAPGALCGVVVGGWLALRLTGLPAGRFADAMAPAVGVGIALARVGCFLNGCCFGDVCDLPWGIEMPATSLPYYEQIEAGLIPRDAPHSRPVHALPLYFALAGLLIAAIGFWLQKRKVYDGQVALVSFFLFSASSAILEPLRYAHEMRVYLGPLPQLQWVTLVMTAGSLIALVLASRWAGR